MKVNGLLMSLDYRAPRQRTKSEYKAFTGKTMEECERKAMKFIEKLGGKFLHGNIVDCEIDDDMPGWFTYEIFSPSRKKLPEILINILNEGKMANA